ncbi:gluconokinase [Mucilaginibacter sp. RS28]|uniref:Gluconokinase n=1 Tax=Mucilaginibacter straminoryzae TaxID=2932774 RepID=A0A9X1X1Q5_9SPHI|nr:gluconokinase [Mucilaginibacter straminoryzae]MCJ8209231.1 gluconokinase [Mucilaginibacter straminoryzae]
MQQYILGIDIGTGSTKAVALGFDGEMLDVAQQYYPVKSPQPGYAEQDPKLIFDAFKSCVAAVTGKLGSPVAISFSSAMHSIMPVDKNGEAMADMIIWADARSQPIADRIRSSGDGVAIYRKSGTPIHAMTPLCKLIWWRENQPDLFHGAARFISIKEYIWYRLFADYQVDYSLASATGLFDIETLHWNPDACKLAEVNEDQLSKPVDTTYHRSDIDQKLASELKLNPETHFVIGSSDGCCANLGSYVDTEGVAAITIGTSGAVRITGKQPVINDEAMIFNYLLYERTFVSGGAVNNGGNAMQWLIRTFLNHDKVEEAAYNEFFDKAKTVPAGSDGLVFLPYLNGERAPIWDTRACGMFFNITERHTQAHFLRAGLEGICLALMNVLQTLEQSSVPVKQVNISGGFINSPLWVQTLADITGKKLVIVQQEDASAMGAIFLAVKALGLPQAIMKRPEKEEATIEPDEKNQAVYQQVFKRFRRLTARLDELTKTTSE